MQLTFCTLRNWGLDSFCVSDYVGYVETWRENTHEIPPVRENEMFLGAVIEELDDENSFNSFVRVAKAIRPAIVVVDFHNIEQNTAEIERMYSRMQSELYGYIDLDSYEDRITLGKCTEERIGNAYVINTICGGEILTSETL